MKALRRVGTVAAAAVLVAALAEELRRPPDQRTWHGAVAGLVPYDFRPPTLARLREALWQPEGPLVVGQVFGVGWALNLGRLARLLGLA